MAASKSMVSVELEELELKLDEEEENPDDVEEEDRFGELFLCWTVSELLESVELVEGVLVIPVPKLTSKEILLASVGGWLTTNVRSVV